MCPERCRNQSPDAPAAKLLIVRASGRGGSRSSKLRRPSVQSRARRARFPLPPREPLTRQATPPPLTARLEAGAESPAASAVLIRPTFLESRFGTVNSTRLSSEMADPPGIQSTSAFVTTDPFRLELRTRAVARASERGAPDSRGP